VGLFSSKEFFILTCGILPVVSGSVSASRSMFSFVGGPSSDSKPKAPRRFGDLARTWGFFSLVVFPGFFSLGVVEIFIFRFFFRGKTCDKRFPPPPAYVTSGFGFLDGDYPLSSCMVSFHSNSEGWKTPPSLSSQGCLRGPAGGVVWSSSSGPPSSP